MKVGDVVVSKAGGPRMVVAKLRDDGAAVCHFWNPTAGEFKTLEINPQALMPYREPAESTPWRVLVGINLQSLMPCREQE